MFAGPHRKFLGNGNYRRCTGVDHDIAACVFDESLQPCYGPIWQYLYVKLFMNLQSFSSFLGRGAFKSTPWDAHIEGVGHVLCPNVLAYFDAIIWLAPWNNEMGEGEQAMKCSHHVDGLKDEHSMPSASASMEEALREVMKNYCE